MLCTLDKHTRECLTIVPASRLRSQDVILTLSRLMRLYGKPEHIRSYHGAESTARIGDALAARRGHWPGHLRAELVATRSVSLGVTVSVLLRMP